MQRLCSSQGLGAPRLWPCAGTSGIVLAMTDFRLKMPLLTALCVLFLLPCVALGALPVGVPSDVLRDYQAWLGERDPYALTDFSGPGARRDVVELALFQQAFDRGCDRRDVTWVQLDSYQRILASLLAGDILATGTTIWSEPFDEGLVALSPPTIPDGQFTALFYTAKGRQQRLRKTEDLTRLTVVSSTQWERDWQALGRVPVKERLDANSWATMVRWVASGRADALLAPSNNSAGSVIEVDGAVLAPMPGLRMPIPGSRHFAFHIHRFAGARAGACFARGLYQMIEAGVVERAYRDAGFWREDVMRWPAARLAPLPKPEPDPDAPLFLPF